MLARYRALCSLLIQSQVTIHHVHVRSHANEQGIDSPVRDITRLRFCQYIALPDRHQ